MAGGRRRAPRARVVKAEPNRFASGWRLVPDALAEMGTGIGLGIAHGPQPSVIVDVVRPADLVALTFAGYDLELVGGGKPLLRPVAGAEGTLVVVLAYQHLGERALYEALAPVPDEDSPDGEPLDPATVPPPVLDGENAIHVPPIQALPSRDSRIVLAVAETETITFSTAGLLEALERLPMVVHPLAKPRAGITVRPSSGLDFHLPGGLIATAGASGVVIAKAPRGVAVPDPSTAAGMARIARDVRMVRSILASEVAVGLRLDELDDPPRFVDSGLVVPDPRVRIRPRPHYSRDAAPLETAINAPYRLVISPSERGGWTHAKEPVGAEGAEHRVELWHSRLGVRPKPEEPDGGGVDERESPQRVVRAVWARDRERFPDWKGAGAPQHDDLPFRMSLDGADRHMLVRQSAETWLGKKDVPISPEPVDVEGLWLSALGAWLDLHGDWVTLPYSAKGLPSILKWDHVAPMGRDQYVRVVYPGYLYPFGHRATLVKLTERKMKVASPSVAGLYQRKFLVVGEPMRRYTQRDLPFQEVRLAPLVTPTLSPDPGSKQDSFFFPFVGGQPFKFVLHCIDKEGRKVRLVAPLMWVAEHYHILGSVEDGYRDDLPQAKLVPADGQDIAFTEVAKGGDTVLPASLLQLDGTAAPGTSTPKLVQAKVRIKAAEHLSPLGDQTIAYEQIYLDHDFGGTDNKGEVWAKIVGAAPQLEFGDPAATPSDKAGGFISPSLEIAGLSRAKGVVGDLARTATGDFDPTAFLGAALPKLFGLVPLQELLSAVGIDLDDAPNVISESLDRIEGFMADLEQAKQTALDAVADAQQVVDRVQQNAVKLIADGRQALADELTANAQAALATATGLEATVAAAVTSVLGAIASVAEATEVEVTTALQNPLQAMGTAIIDMRAAAPQLPPLVGNRMHSLADVLAAIVDAADLIHDVFQFVNGLATSAVQGRFRYEWRPKLANWPQGSDPVLEVPERGLVLAVDGRVSGKGKASVEVLAELKDFSLNLLPGETLVRFRFDHMSFKSGTSGKTEVDVVLNDIEFVGILGFVETLKDLIPFDGFSDPPFVDVTAAGLSAGFTLALPNVAVGVFNLSNISLGADVHVPFLGDVVTVGFNFCTRERPFTLAVLFIGGGGWFLIRLSPDGLDVLELGLEAGAVLAVDFGVASGSISAMIGVYIRLEGDKGSLTAYFRLRGEVDVLGLISASIELYLSLTYDFPTGKLTGRAQLTVKVEVLFFSTSVTIECERRFAGSNGDPSFEEVMGLEPDGTSPAWSQYCLAFGGA